MVNDTTPLKRCTKCGNEYPATTEYFYKSGKYLQSRCKPCISSYHKSNRAKNVEKARERDRRNRAKNAKRRSEYNRQWRLSNREKARKLWRTWSLKNHEKVREKDRRYRLDNPDKIRERNRRRCARKANLPATFTAEHERLALDYFNGCCAVCGRQLKDLFCTHTVHWDHWVPMSKGGATTPDNMVPLCGGLGGCNNRKHDSDPVEWVNASFNPRAAKSILRRVNKYFDSLK